MDILAQKKRGHRPRYQNNSPKLLLTIFWMFLIEIEQPIPRKNVDAKKNIQHNKSISY